ncbi:hypothetical protein BDN70DRAFT_939009 [Pholiota conissans]|uniref:Zn(2)-C6 fungal-type domain-containing protein n=1 Tax=Pholiota conissans TaxID=109636 RepID=A0A9P5YMN0_9AGAR|nr:hypothetical protein BDN70DRAFT_939009 [Pholiota conissans]
MPTPSLPPVTRTDDDDEYAPETIPKGKAKRRKGQPGPTKGSAPSPADENDDDDSIVVNPKKPKKGKGKAKAKQPQEEATDDEKAAPREYVVSGTYDPPCHHCVGGGIKCVYPPHRGSCIPCKVSKKKCEFALTKQEMGNIFRVPKTKKPKLPSTAPLQNDNYVEISDDESSEAPASPPAAPIVSKTPAPSSIAAPQPAASSSARTSAPSSAPFTTLVEPSIQRITSMLERIEQGMTTRVDNIEASLLGMGTRLGRMERMLVHLDRNDSQLEFHGGAVDRLLYAFCEWQGMPGVGRNPRPGQPSAPSGSQPSPPIAQAGPSNSATSATSHQSAQVRSSAVGQGQSAWPVQAQQQHLGPRDAPTTSAHTATTVVPASATPMMPERLPPQDASHSVGGHALKSPPPVDMASPPAAPFPSADGPASPSASEVLAVPIGVPGAASDGDQEMGVARNTSVATGADDETAATLTAPLPEVPASSDGPANEDIPDVTLEPATPSTSQAGTSAQEELLAPPAPRRSPRIRLPTPMPSGSGKRKSSNASSSESKRQKL